MPEEDVLLFPRIDCHYRQVTVVEPHPPLQLPPVFAEHHEVVEHVMHYVQGSGVAEEQVEQGHRLPGGLLQGLQTHWLVPDAQLDVPVITEEDGGRPEVAILPDALPHQLLRHLGVLEHPLCLQGQSHLSAHFDLVEGEPLGLLDRLRGVQSLVLLVVEEHLTVHLV